MGGGWGEGKFFWQRIFKEGPLQLNEYHMGVWTMI
jgi:hypothetical protein